VAKEPTLRTKVTEMLKRMLGERATYELVSEVAPELLAELTANKNVPTVADLLIRKVIRLALDKDKGNQWAVELIFDRVEGKSVAGEPVRQDSRVVEDRLDDITREHLNSIAAQFAKRAKDELGGDKKAENRPAGPAGRLLDLHKNRPDRPENLDRKPPLAEGTPPAGGG
jgi:uncharacterized membrane-anchored protein YjiN (DUF445 family)